MLHSYIIPNNNTKIDCHENCDNANYYNFSTSLTIIKIVWVNMKK